jgi:flagellar protein FliO/FliZ
MGRWRGATRSNRRMWDVLYYLAVVLFLAVALIAGAFALRTHLGGAGPIAAFGGLFGPKPERRVYVVEQSNLDGRRRLVLIRRDDVEHLIMTGGPVDVLIETGIGAPPQEHPNLGGPYAHSSSRASARS